MNFVLPRTTGAPLKSAPWFFLSYADVANLPSTYSFNIPFGSRTACTTCNLPSFTLPIVVVCVTDSLYSLVLNLPLAYSTTVVTFSLLVTCCPLTLNTTYPSASIDNWKSSSCFNKTVLLDLVSTVIDTLKSSSPLIPFSVIV